jgi:DNA-directed RNA polymerase subunit RPC12/RpoP
MDLYECTACGAAGQSLQEMHVVEDEETESWVCLECNSNAEVILQSEIKAFDEMVENRKPKFDFGDIDLDDI